MSVFVVDKSTMKIVKTSKDLVSKSLTSLGIKILAVIACVSYAFGVVLASVMSKTRLTGNKEKKRNTKRC